jgi:drug/metabolite transporter (DMT)-like permease
MAEGTGAQPRWKSYAALSAVYFIWGSTYLVISFAIETIPPLAMAGVRTSLAGLLLIAWTRLRHEERPRLIHWRSAWIIGTLLFVAGNGGVTWAEQHVPTGFAALMIGAVPIWIVLINWLAFGGDRPNQRMAMGLGLGLCGLALLVGPADLVGGEHIDSRGIIVLVIASLSWSVGSLYARQAPLPDNSLLAAGMEIFCGGMMLLMTSAGTGEWARLDLGGISLRSVLAMLYLSLIGSLVSFSAYVWLLRHTTPARATSYAYVNPVVAVILGWAFAGEPVTIRMIAATTIIVLAVVVITSLRAQPPARPREVVQPEVTPETSAAK